MFGIDDDGVNFLADGSRQWVAVVIPDSGIDRRREGECFIGCTFREGGKPLGDVGAEVREELLKVVLSR